MDKNKIIIITLSVVIISLVNFMIIEDFQENQIENYEVIFSEGYNLGLEDGLSTIYEITENCQEAELVVGNKTKAILDSACVRDLP